MKKKIMALLSMVIVASIHARSFFITVTNGTPYTIQHVASMSGKGAQQAVTGPGVESMVEADANATNFPMFTLLDDGGKVLRKIMPYMPNAAYHEPMFHEGDDITFIGYGGEIVITHNGLAVPFRIVE